MCVDAVVVDTIETPLEIPVPANFSARTIAAMPAEITRPDWSRSDVAVAIAVLLVLVAAATAVVRPEDILKRMDAFECSVLAVLMGIELAGVVLWLGRGTRV
jgi:hypothetical protein